MKTKTTIPWAAILTEYNANFSKVKEIEQWYICHLSLTFKSLWAIESVKLEIKQAMDEFLNTVEKDKSKVRVELNSWHDCLLYGSLNSDEMTVLKKRFLEYMTAKSKPKTKYSYFRHCAAKCFGNSGGPTFLVRRDNKTGEFETVYYSDKRIFRAGNKEDCSVNVTRGIWIAANQKEVNKIKRLYREPKYLYYRHRNSEHFGNPKSVYKYIIRYNVKTGVSHSMFYDKKECNDIGKSHLWHDAINKGEWIPARQKEIRLAIKLNKQISPRSAFLKK